MKIQNSTLPKFEISILKKFGFGQMRNWDTKTKILIFKEFGFAKSKKSAPQNPKFDYDFDFLVPKFNFENLKTFSFSSIPLESNFGTSKFEIAVIENP